MWYIAYHLLVIKIRKKFKEKTGKCSKPPLLDFNESMLVVGRKRHKVYFSHAVRGSLGASATYEQSMANCHRAIYAANIIAEWFDNLDMYVPANAEKFVGYTYLNGMLTDEQILHVDCQILSDCEALIAYDFDTSKGTEIEVKFANDHGIPVFRFKELNLETLIEIEKFIGLMKARNKCMQA
jgi:hypothetical protein